MGNNSLTYICSLQKDLAIARIINIPVELSKKDIIENVLKETDFDKENSIIPSSSGSGDAIINAAMIPNRYFSKNPGVFLIK